MRPGGANPRETNPKAAHPNSMREARLSCELPAESTGEAIMSLPKPSNQSPVVVTPLDLGEAACRGQLAERLRSEPVAGLCNSAGFGTSGVFQTLPIERESEEIVLNSLALMELTHAALPGMVERGAGAVLNIASIAGFQPIPYMAVYSATKAFVQTFSEAVHEELHGTGV